MFDSQAINYFTYLRYVARLTTYTVSSLAGFVSTAYAVEILGESGTNSRIATSGWRQPGGGWKTGTNQLHWQQLIMVIALKLKLKVNLYSVLSRSHEIISNPLLSLTERAYRL